MAVAATLALSACSGDEAANGDGGDGGGDRPQDLPRDPMPDLPNIDRWFPDWAGACDPTDQNCGVMEECTIDCAMKGFVCSASKGGTGKIDEACTVGSCAKGLTCVGSASGAKCRKWCREDKDCPMGKTCSTMGVSCMGATGTIGWLCWPFP